jgi:hypothetical protein
VDGGGLPECTASYCGDAEKFCMATMPLCGDTAALLQQDPVGALKGCTSGIAWVAQHPPDAGDGSAVMASLLACGLAAKDCLDVMKCRSFALTCGNAKGCGGADGGTPVGNYPDGGLPPGTYTLPGDNPACVGCALAKCKKESQYCFVDGPSTPICHGDAGPNNLLSDCCIDYRACLAECATAFPDPPQYAACVLQSCDVSLPQGKMQYGPYEACMQAQCANCGGM